MNKQEEIKQLRELAERILNRMDELILSYDDADEKLAAQGCSSQDMGRADAGKDWQAIRALS